MIRALRRKFVLIAMGSLLIILVAIISAINGLSLYQMNRTADAMLAFLARNGGSFPEFDRRREPDPPFAPPMNEETRFATRYFTVRTDAQGAILQIDTGHIAAISEADAERCALTALAGPSTGYVGAYKYLLSQEADGLLLVFLDCRAQIESARALLAITCLIGLLLCAVMFVLLSVFSRHAVAPIAQSIEKQRRFITDASHEIKTPLSIIAASADALSLDVGDSEWIESIRRQIARMNGLVADMVSLSRMDEDRARLTMLDFSISDAVREAAEPFEKVAEAAGKRLRIAVQTGLSYRGDEAAIRQLVSLLLDNAVKYASAGGEIRLTLAREGRSTVLCAVNPCDRVPEGDLSRLFRRFYRDDESRSRESGGHGLGLSVAQAITLAHKGRLVAERRGDTMIAFSAIL